LQETQREPTSPKSPTPAPDRQSLIRPPPLRQSSRGPDDGPTSPTTGRRTQRDAQSANQPPSANSTVTSWRSNAAPLPPVSPRRSSHSPVTPAVTFPSAFQVLGAQLLNPSNDESLEEVEFTDLGKFVGVEPNPDEAVAPSPVQRIDVSTEDDQPPPTRARSDLDPSWRRKTSLASVKEQPSVVTNTVPDAVSESSASRETHTVPTSPSVPATSIGTGSLARPPNDGSFPGHTLSVPSSLSSQRSPRAPSISAFDDTMSRIKGAMQTKPHRSAHHTDRAAANSTAHSADQPRFGKGVTQTSRSHPPRVPEPEEPFTTLTELHNDIQSGQQSRVRLPPSRAHEPLSKRELANLKRPILPLQWDVLSWDPPVDGMSVRDYSINSVLFRKPLPQRGHPRYHVSLPPSGSYLVRGSSPATPKVHLPAKPLLNKTLAVAGAFGRPRVADENSNWRRTLPSIPDQVESTASSEGLVTRSGSSPPDTDKASDVTPSVETETILPVQLSTKPRAEPKMPAGASVAFYRESTSCPSVSFTVSSELEGARQLETPIVSLPTEEHAPVSPPLGNSKGNEVDGASTLPTPREKAESKSSDGSVSTIRRFSDGIWLNVGNG
jgi:serine/arginine repetitive matrix protein 2